MKPLVPIVWNATIPLLDKEVSLLGHFNLSTGEKTILCNCRPNAVIANQRYSICSSCGRVYDGITGGNLL